MHFAAPPENDRSPSPKQIRGPELGPALKRDRLLQRVRAARKRLTPARGTVAKLR
jgi:hypothetical protein